MEPIVTGIQQVGVGVADVEEAWSWYRTMFGMDVCVFKDTGEAPFMTRYTGNNVHSRTAVLALNLSGGGCFEIWQYESRTPQAPERPPQMGDLGIFAVCMHATDVAAAHATHHNAGASVKGGPAQDPIHRPHFFTYDPYGNLFQVIRSEHMFAKTRHPCGGVAGVLIGVTDPDRARVLYADTLGYDRVEYDKTGVFDDLQGIPGGEERVRRVKLTQSEPGVGHFGRLFGPSTIELFQCLDREPVKIFKNRFWGDMGFIHVCFDVKHTDELQARCADNGFPFTVDSLEAFDMGEAGGRFGYTEDPDGTLVEFVETFRLPIIEKLGLYLNLEKRDPRKPIPDWMLKALRFSRVKD